MTGNNTPPRLQALNELEILHRQANRKLFQNVPAHRRPAINFSDKTTGQLIGCILRWLELNNCWAIQMKTTGHYLQGQLFTDVLGHRSICPANGLYKLPVAERLTYRAVIAARPMSIEVKVGSEHISYVITRRGKPLSGPEGLIGSFGHSMNSCAIIDHCHHLGKKS